MPIRKIKPTTPGRRHMQYLDFSAVTAAKPTVKSLLKAKKRTSGRNTSGKITVRHRGGGHKRQLRIVDFRRTKLDIMGTVKAIEYDPNRTVNLALVAYIDGDRRYILAPLGLKVGHTIISSRKAEIKIGNALPIKNIPVGTMVHNIELKPGKGGQLARGAGAYAIVRAHEKKFTTLKLPSGEVRLFPSDCLATIGQLGNLDRQNISLGKAGRSRHLGRRPTVRGVAQHPASHPHGGGEGKSGIGMKSPKSPWGKRTLGKKTRKKIKNSNKYIVKRRK